MNRPRRLVLDIALGLVLAIFILGSVPPRAHAMPAGFSGYQTQSGFNTISNSAQGGNTYVQYNEWWFWGNSADNGCLSNLGYCGYLADQAILMQGEVSASGFWCEDTGGISDPGGPTMVVNGRLSTQGETDIVSNSPSYIPSGTYSVGVSVGLTDAGVSGSYSIPNVQEGLTQNSPYTSFTFNQGLNTGGCNSAQLAYYWDFAQALESEGKSGSTWPKYTYTHFGDNTGHFWNVDYPWNGLSLRQAVEAGFYTTFQGTG